MKKTLLSLFAVASAGLSFGQVNIDWSVDQILSPTQLNSSASGTAIPVHIVLKNNGTDKALAGDSMFISFYVQVGASAVIYFPSNNLSIVNFAKTLSRDVPAGDTIHYVNNSFKSQLNIYPSVDAKFRFTCLLLNRSRGVALETTTAANNAKTVDLVWYNIQGWPVSVSTPNVTSVNVFPNIAQNEVTIQNNVVEPQSPMVINIFDLAGKLISSSKVEPAYEVKLNLSGLANGTYVVSVENGSTVKTSKLVVQK